MKIIHNACVLQANALEINVGDQIEQLDQIIKETKGHNHFKKTFVTDGMWALLSRGMARLAGKSTDTIFHLKQAMGGGKTHLMVSFRLLAKDAELRKIHIGDMDAFGHVNNTAYFKYFESARITYFEQNNFMEFMETNAIGPILASTQCRFKIPLSYPDQISMGARVDEIGKNQFTMK